MYAAAAKIQALDQASGARPLEGAHPAMGRPSVKRAVTGREQSAELVGTGNDCLAFFIIDCQPLCGERLLHALYSFQTLGIAHLAGGCIDQTEQALMLTFTDLSVGAAASVLRADVHGGAVGDGVAIKYTVEFIVIVIAEEHGVMGKCIAAGYRILAARHR